MSGVFVANPARYVIAEEAVSVERLLDENEHIIELIADFVKKGRFYEAVQMQTILQRNLVYLVSLVDQYNLNASESAENTDNMDSTTTTTTAATTTTTTTTTTNNNEINIDNNNNEMVIDE
ncbi:unnamed protein product [Trichobilharzia szidati]|nr:unnamed protein product [Trichobilharzia szidati]